MQIKKLSIIILTICISYLFAAGFLFATNIAYRISAHPGISLLMRIIFFMVIVILFILRERDYVFYLFLLSFPFYRIAFSGITLPLIFCLMLCAIYSREIVFYIKKYKDPNRLAFILFFISIVYTTIIAFDKVAATNRVIYFITLFLSYLLLVSLITSPQALKRVYYIIVGIGLLGALISFYQLVFGVESIRFFFGEYNPNVSLGVSVSRIPSFFPEAQFSGIFFAMIFFLALGLSYLNPKHKWINFFVMFISFAAMTLSGTRISLFAFGFCCLMLVMHRLRPIKIFGVLSLMIVCILVALFLKNSVNLSDNITYKLRMDSFDKSINYRQKIWQRSFPIIIHNPLGVGLGGENLYNAGMKERAYFLDNFVRYPGTRGATHFESSYLTILYSLGTIGFLAFIMFFLNSFRNFLIFYKTYRDVPMGKFVYCLIMALIILSIGISTSPQINHFQPAFLLVTLFASASAIAQMKSIDYTKTI